MTRSAAFKTLASFLLLALVFVAMATRYWGLTIDDAYISARYAWNGAQGAGLVFNPGERVMGYTNLLLVLIETAVYTWGGDGIVAAKMTGLVAARAAGVAWVGKVAAVAWHLCAAAAPCPVVA